VAPKILLEPRLLSAFAAIHYFIVDSSNDRRLFLNSAIREVRGRGRKNRKR